MPTPERTLKMLQEDVDRFEIERGFSKESSLQKCLLLGEEVGELFKAVRRSEGMGVDVSSISHDVGAELADILNYLLAIANRYGVDLDSAFLKKEQMNSERNWEASR